MSEYNKQGIGNTSVDLTTVVAMPAVAVAGGCVRVFLLVFYHHFRQSDSIAFKYKTAIDTIHYPIQQQ